MQYMITMGQLQHVPHKPLIFQQGSLNSGLDQGIPGQLPSQGYPFTSQVQDAAYPSGARLTSLYEYLGYDCDPVS